MILNMECIQLRCPFYFLNKSNHFLRIDIRILLLPVIFPVEIPAYMFHKTGSRAGKSLKRCPEVSCRLLWEYIRSYVSCGFYNPRETITHEGISWEPVSLENSASNGFSMEIFTKSAGNSAGKLRVSSTDKCKQVNLEETLNKGEMGYSISNCHILFFYVFALSSVVRCKYQSMESNMFVIS